MKKTKRNEQQTLPRARAAAGTEGAQSASEASAQAAKPVKLSPTRKRTPIGLVEENFHNSETHSVHFEHFDPAAQSVFVAGSFNKWQPTANLMKKQLDGKWSTEMLLQPGEHEYRFVVDGQWKDDPMATRFVANEYGGLNSVVQVKAMEG